MITTLINFVVWVILTPLLYLVYKRLTKDPTKLAAKYPWRFAIGTSFVAFLFFELTKHFNF